MTDICIVIQIVSLAMCIRYGAINNQSRWWLGFFSRTAVETSSWIYAPISGERRESQDSMRPSIHHALLSLLHIVHIRYHCTAFHLFSLEALSSRGSAFRESASGWMAQPESSTAVRLIIKQLQERSFRLKARGMSTIIPRVHIQYIYMNLTFLSVSSLLRVVGRHGEGVRDISFDSSLNCVCVDHDIYIFVGV